MDLNSIVFPAPKCSYTSESRNLMWIDSHPSNTPIFHLQQRQKQQQDNNSFNKENSSSTFKSSPSITSCMCGGNIDTASEIEVNFPYNNTNEIFRNSPHKSPQRPQKKSVIQINKVLQDSNNSNKTNNYTYQLEQMLIQSANKQSKSSSSQQQVPQNFLKHNLHSPIRVSDNKQSLSSPLKRASELGPELSKLSATKVPCLFLPSHIPSDKLLIYFHGNAEDIGGSYDFVVNLRKHLRLNILSVEYPGYGLYPGKPNSDQILADADSVYEYARSQLKVQSSNILLFGRSIGSGPACYLAGTRSVGGLILMSPYTSIRNVAKDLAGGMIQYLVAERFRNIDYLKHAKCPSLFIHGKQDTLIPYSHSIQLMEMIEQSSNTSPSNAFIHLSEDMTHNDFHILHDLLSPIQSFFIQAHITINPIAINRPSSMNK